MQIRELPAAEWERLKSVSDGFCPDPKYGLAFVAEDGERIVSRAFLVTTVHLEGSWIAEDKRGGTLAKRMITRVEQKAKEVGLGQLMVYATCEQHETYLQRLGYTHVPLTLWMKEL